MTKLVIDKEWLEEHIKLWESDLNQFSHGARCALKEVLNNSTPLGEEKEIKKSIFKLKVKSRPEFIECDFSEIIEEFQDYFWEKLDEKYGCDGNCMNESCNHCECTPYFEDCEDDLVLEVREQQEDKE